MIMSGNVQCRGGKIKTPWRIDSHADIRVLKG